eukprot:978344-Prymnesium_polylepis.1
MAARQARIGRAAQRRAPACDGCRVAFARRSSRRERWARKNACRSGSPVAGCVRAAPEHVCARSVGTFGGSR